MRARIACSRGSCGIRLPGLGHGGCTCAPFMKTTLASILSFSLLSLAALSGCATDVDADPDPVADEPVVAKVDDDSTSLAPQQDNGGTTSGCTTTSECDKNYCCTTETCRFSTFIKCVPNTTKATLSMAYIQ
jgi:hypothetical protein